MKNTAELANGGKLLVLPVAEGTVIFEGSLVAIDAEGYAKPAAKATGLKAAGRAETYADNSGGAAGDITVTVRRGVFVWDNAADTGKLEAKHVLGTCYMLDDHTVTSISTGASAAGKVIQIDKDGVAVETL